MRLHAIRAFEGDCLLLESGGGEAKYVLVDGGPDGTFEDHLKPYLEATIPGGRLEAVIVSHVDRDHIVGVLDLFAELNRQRIDGEDPLISPAELWHNSFSDAIDDDEDTIAKGVRMVLANAGVASTIMTDVPIAFFGIAEGERLRREARLLHIPINRTFGGELICPDLLPNPALEIGGMRMTVIGPTDANLRALQEEWLEWIRRNRTAARPEQLANADKSIPNLSSIVLLVEEDGRSLLLTGDARGDHIEQGLDQAGLRPDGTFHVNVMKLQHHGSDRNATRTFFRRNTADAYVASANGKHGNPDYETLVWIVEEAHAAERAIEIVATNDAPSIQRIRQTHPEADFGYRLRLPGDDDHAVIVELT
ncbi:MBL fold metallo-hydrolase [Sphingomonas parva]|uniref:MBL fold metallo-hydrolase n=1 Tax=Sphingomonas parva TaxID=2555898 RepID=A0A4Y8ZXX6_9SPHN|nr:MBL fold metallo-hydrolase [Sphingomonas parva]TFI59729.1 MBL fold metallo-hydrolase [Sphingomonas parva]